MTKENKDYKHSDYLNRQNDPYAQAKYEIVMAWLPKQNNLRILNAGCGSGEMNVLLTKNTSWRVDAVDIDEEAIKLSQNIKSDFNLQNLNVIHSGIENFESSGGYDAVVCSDVLEHIENDIAVLKKFYELLKPGGVLCVSVPALNWLFGYHDEMLGHYRRYSRKILRQRLSNLFEVRECRYFGLSLIPTALVYSKILRRAYPMLPSTTRDGTRSIKTKILETILRIESAAGVPIGISLIAMGVKK